VVDRPRQRLDGTRLRGPCHTSGHGSHTCSQRLGETARGADSLPVKRGVT
jgi:hypothetical protein